MRQCWSYEPRPFMEDEVFNRAIESWANNIARDKERLIWEELKNAHKDAFYKEPAVVPHGRKSVFIP